MKLKDGLVLRKVAGQFVIIPTGKRVREIVNTVYISSSAAYLWDHMKDSFTEEELIDLIMQQYTGVTREIAREDIEAFLETLRINNILEPDPDEPVAKGGSVWVTVQNEPES